jgi:hypothetical protein
MVPKGRVRDEEEAGKLEAALVEEQDTLIAVLVLVHLVERVELG